LFYKNAGDFLAFDGFPASLKTDFAKNAPSLVSRIHIRLEQVLLHYFLLALSFSGESNAFEGKLISDL